MYRNLAAVAAIFLLLVVACSSKTEDKPAQAAGAETGAAAKKQAPKPTDPPGVPVKGDPHQVDFKPMKPEESTQILDLRQIENEKEARIEIDLYIHPDANRDSQQLALFWAFNSKQAGLKPWKSHKEYTLLQVTAYAGPKPEKDEKPMATLSIDGPQGEPKMVFNLDVQMKAAFKLRGK